MTNKVTMPEPVATVFGDRIHHNKKTSLQDGDTLITTGQAEAYANAMVKQALKEAIAEATKISDKYAYGYSGHEVDAVDETIDAIRALIPKEPPCET